jgi:hypothetical protein
MFTSHKILSKENQNLKDSMEIHDRIFIRKELNKFRIDIKLNSVKKR